MCGHCHQRLSEKALKEHERLYLEDGVTASLRMDEQLILDTIYIYIYPLCDVLERLLLYLCDCLYHCCSLYEEIYDYSVCTCILCEKGQVGI